MPESIQKTVKKQFKAGDVIFNQGDLGNEMYIVESGAVELYMFINDEEKIKLGDCRKNNFFGEMALFGNNKRTATALVTEDADIIVINNQIMKNQLSKLPRWFVMMFKTLIERLRDTDLKIIHEISQDKTDE